jgi:ribosome biogenesis GTPase
MSLQDWGWDSYFETLWSSQNPGNVRPARVISQQRTLWRVAGDFPGLWAKPGGKLRLDAASGADWPAIGDWVVISSESAAGPAQVQAVLPRRSSFSRKEPGKRFIEQVIAANVDTAFIVCGLDDDFNPRRIERYLAQCWDSCVKPDLILNKADICTNLPETLRAAQQVAIGSPVRVISCRTGDGIDQLAEALLPRRTNVLLGSSGAGKSTLLNQLLGRNAQATQPARESDSRGRHTTTARELFALPGGALLIDTPGLRELQLWTRGSESVNDAFPEIEALAAHCRFRDCRHDGEPGCAVAAALAEGKLIPQRLENRRKLLREQDFLLRKTDPGLRRAEKQRFKVISRRLRERYRHGQKDPRSG